MAKKQKKLKKTAPQNFINQNTKQWLIFFVLVLSLSLLVILLGQNSNLVSFIYAFF